MYTDFYQFSQKPFDVTPDPSLLYLSESHKEALATLIYGIKERRGFIVLVGEVGTGKTTLINAAIERLGDNIKTAFIFNTDVTFTQILQMALIEFGLATGEETISKFTALTRLNQYAVRQFSQGVNIVLIIDEAQNLDIRTMEKLRLLSNLETSKHKLVQIVMSGQPELDEKLRRRELRQLAQRINMKRYILPLNESDTYQYIRHHLDSSGYKNRRLFDAASIRLIWQFSKGIPRKINMLCDNALLLGYALGKRKISGAIVQEAVKDLESSPFDNEISFSQLEREEPQTNKQKGWNVRYALAAGLLFLLILLGAGFFGLWQQQFRLMESIFSASEDTIHAPAQVDTGDFGYNKALPDRQDFKNNEKYRKWLTKKEQFARPSKMVADSCTATGMLKNGQNI